MAEVESERKTVEAPDGGWGWVICIATFLINFTAVGLGASTGIVLLGLVDLFDCPLSKTSIIGSLYSGMPMFVGPLVLCMMMLNASNRQVIMLGGFIATLSTLASAFANQIEVVYVTFGLFTSFWTGVSYFAGTTILGSYFKKKRTLAIGIASSGSGGGAFALNYLIERSISFYGMRGTFLLMSGLILNICVYGALCRPLKTVKKTKSNTEEETVESEKVVQCETNSGYESDEKIPEDEKETKKTDSYDVEIPGNHEDSSPSKITNRIASKCKYLILSIFDPVVLKNSGMRWLLAIYLFSAVNETILLYLPAKVVSVGLSRQQGALIMSIYGGVFAASQIMVGIFADVFHIPKSYLLMFSMFGLSVTFGVFTLCNTFALFVLCAIAFGICNGFSNSLRVVLVASVLGVEKLNKGYSTLCFLTGITYIITPIISGALYDATGSFNVIFYYCCICLLISFASSSGIVYMQLKNRFFEK